MEMKSKELLQVKMDFLRSRTWVVAAQSAAVGAVPIIGVSAVYDVAAIMALNDHMRKQLGIDDRSLKRIAANQGLSVDELIENIRMEIGADKTLMKMLGSANPFSALPCEMMGLAVSEIVEGSARLTLPIIGSVIGGGISFVSTYAGLSYMLNQYEKMASACLDIVFAEDEK